LVINIEVDCVHHRREKKKRFSKMRDEYLVSRGVVIERMEITTLRAMSEQEVEEWVLDITAKAIKYSSQTRDDTRRETSRSKPSVDWS
jgi:hypothetical protein